MLRNGRYGVWIGGSGGTYKYFGDLGQAVAAAAAEARRNGDKPTMFTDFGRYAMVNGVLNNAYLEVFADGTSKPFPEHNALAELLQESHE